MLFGSGNPGIYRWSWSFLEGLLLRLDMLQYLHCSCTIMTCGFRFAQMKVMKYHFQREIQSSTKECTRVYGVWVTMIQSLTNDVVVKRYGVASIRITSLWSCPCPNMLIVIPFKRKIIFSVELKYLQKPLDSLERTVHFCLIRNPKWPTEGMLASKWLKVWHSTHKPV